MSLALSLASPPASGADQAIRIAVATTLSGPEATVGAPVLDAAQLAVNEANAESGAAPIELLPYDDHGTERGARDAESGAVAAGAVAVVGPALTVLSAAVGPAYAAAKLPSIVPTAHGDTVTDSATTFRPLFSSSEMAEWLGYHLWYVLRNNRAVVIYSDNGFGRPFASGFKRAAARCGIVADYRGYHAFAQAAAFARAAAADPRRPAVVLGGIDADSEAMVVALRRSGMRAPILGPSAIGVEAFAARFRREPEERRAPGYFTEGIYFATPMLLDSANAATLAFADRFRARFGHDPSYTAAQGYEATLLAIAAARAARRDATDIVAQRVAADAFLRSLDGPERAIPGLSGPLWFTRGRGRVQNVRIGRFHGGKIESAPIQLVPVENFDNSEVASGAVVAIGSGRFARRQRVVYTGIYVNEIPRVDIAQSSFTADFYLWLRYAKGTWPGAPDPAAIEFPDLLKGSFEPEKTAARSDLPDGTSYRLWHVRGDFRNAFDLHRYPMDRQTLAIRFFNAGAASDRIVYVDDRRASARTGDASDTAAGGASVRFARYAPDAFVQLTQWEPIRVDRRRDILVTPSALGDPRLVGLDRVREASGFYVSVELARRTGATIIKNLLPVAIMTLVMFASLFFPPTLVKEKVTVAITAALSGAVLLTAINAQLGGVGYTMAVEYVFFVFFALSLLCIVAVLAGERLRSSGRAGQAILSETVTRWAYLGIVAVTGAAAWWSAAHG